jgi:hypothetical protein
MAMDFNNLFWSLGIFLLMAVVFAFGLGAFSKGGGGKPPPSKKKGKATDS